MYTLSISSKKHTEFISLNGQLNSLIKKEAFEEGLCMIFIPHTTAGITINENADPDVKKDMIKTLEQMIPWENGYSHLEGNSAAHLKASIMGFSQLIPVENGRLVLGTWQDVYLCEFDGPRTRKTIIKLVGGNKDG